MEEQVKRNESSACNPVTVQPHAAGYFTVGTDCCFHEGNTECGNSKLMWQGRNADWHNSAINFTARAPSSAQHVFQYSNGTEAAGGSSSTKSSCSGAPSHPSGRDVPLPAVSTLPSAPGRIATLPRLAKLSSRATGSSARGQGAVTQPRGRSLRSGEQRAQRQKPGRNPHLKGVSMLQKQTFSSSNGLQIL